MLEKVISGGQTGVDQAALRAAAACQIETGGWAPASWQTERGPAPWLTRYGMLPHQGGYADRTRANVEAADATLLLVWGVAGLRSPGSRLVLRLGRELGKPVTVADLLRLPARDAAHLLPEGVRTLNVAGNRESGAPGVGAKAEAFLVELLSLLRTQS